jgi:hypothetical protein
LQYGISQLDFKGDRPFTKENVMGMLRLAAFCVASSAIIVSITGCAGMSQTTSVVDQQKVNAIERAAQTQGVKVYWMNYPNKRANTAAAPSQQGS